MFCENYETVDGIIPRKCYVPLQNIPPEHATFVGQTREVPIYSVGRLKFVFSVMTEASQLPIVSGS